MRHPRTRPLSALDASPEPIMVVFTRIDRHNIKQHLISSYKYCTSLHCTSLLLSTREFITMSKAEGDYYSEDYAVPEGSRAPVTTGSGARQGHRFMIFCCDMRRAVIILDAITISLVLLHLILFLGFGIQLEADTGGSFRVPSVGKAIFVGLVGVAMPGCGLYGALKYKYHFVALAAFYFGFQLFLDLCTLKIYSIIWGAVFLYVHAVLAKEMNTGIMTEENYPNEKYSCCCV